MNKNDSSGKNKQLKEGKSEGRRFMNVTLMSSVQMVRIFFLRYKKRKRKNLASKVEYFGLSTCPYSTQSVQKF